MNGIAGQILLQNALSGAGNGPCSDDRHRGQAKHRPAENCARCGFVAAFYDFSITSTKSQPLTRYSRHLSERHPEARVIGGSVILSEAKDLCSFAPLHRSFASLRMTITVFLPPTCSPLDALS